MQGMSNYQQHLVLKKVRLLKLQSRSLDAMYEARQTLVKDTKELLRSKKMRQRKLGYQVHASGLQSPEDHQRGDASLAKAQSLTVNAMVSAVEDMVTDVNEIEFELDEEMELE